jgi:large subunit ribosomal protein L13
MKTFSPKPSDIQHQWWVVDADGLVLGRLATEVAKLLRGKHKPIFAPHVDVGDFVIVINAGKIRLTGKKAQQKDLIRHTGYPGGLKRISYEKLLATRPSLAIETAVKGMLPHNRLGRAMAKKLKVYDGAEHPHSSQSPQPWIKQEVNR